MIINLSKAKQLQLSIYANMLMEIRDYDLKYDLVDRIYGILKCKNKDESNSTYQYIDDLILSISYYLSIKRYDLACTYIHRLYYHHPRANNRNIKWQLLGNIDVFMIQLLSLK